MTLTVNGKRKEIAQDGMSLVELLRLEGVKEPGTVTVELNGKVLKQKEIPSVRVADGDRIEFLYFIGGGDG